MGDVPSDVHPQYKGRGDGSTMKALAWFGPRDVRLIDAPIPDITEPQDVIVKVTGTTVCGSDLHIYHGEIAAMQKGDILGHEVSMPTILLLSDHMKKITSFIRKFMGIVDRIGPSVKNLHVGQRVVASFMIACGECSYCKD